MSRIPPEHTEKGAGGTAGNRYSRVTTTLATSFPLLMADFMQGLDPGKLVLGGAVRRASPHFLQLQWSESPLRSCPFSSARSQHPPTTSPCSSLECLFTRATTLYSHSSWCVTPFFLSHRPNQSHQFSGLLSASIVFDIIWVFKNDQNGFSSFLLFLLWLLKARTLPAHTCSLPTHI